MSRIVPALATATALALCAAPGFAQDQAAPGTSRDLEEGMDMLSEGARTLLRGLVGRAEPGMRDLAETLRNWNLDGIGPEDLGQYEPPEILPNGDIIIRRKTPAEDHPLDDEVEI